MSDAAVTRLVELADVPRGASWIDLGSGDGKILIEAARRYGIKGVGIERIAPLRIWSRIKIRLAHANDITIRSGDFFKEDLSKYDVVSFYLLPMTTEELLPKLQRELKPGALLLFHRYPVTGLVLEREDAELKIYVARAPLNRV
jgi:cyclopropane fatty-acyl-phospholipid synthase-like methyltransferase